MTLVLDMLINDTYRTVHREIRCTEIHRSARKCRDASNEALRGDLVQETDRLPRVSGLLSMEGATKQVLKVRAAPLSTGVTAQDAFCKTRVSQKYGENV